jgi:hypothetical protein
MPSSSTHLPCSYRGLKSRLVVLIGVLLIVSGCATSQNATVSATPTAHPTATLAPTATPIPHPVSAFTCAAGSLPIGSGFTQINCAVGHEGPYNVLHASYTGRATNSELDFPRLTHAGWIMIDRTQRESPNGAIDEDLYFNESAWFADEYSYPASTMSLDQGIPTSGAAPIPCGQTLSTGDGQILLGLSGGPVQGFPTPSGMVLTSVGGYTFAPACLQDVLQFYTTALPAAGWTVTAPFQSVFGSGAELPVEPVTATVSRGNTTLALWLDGNEGTPTHIWVTSSH